MEYKELIIKIDEKAYEHILKAKSIADMLGIDIVNTMNAVKNGTVLSEEHGDLIDRNELEPDTEWDDYYDGFTSYSEMQIRNAKAIIETDKESEDNKDEKFR